MQLHKLGFKAQSDSFTVHQLVNNKSIKANFKSFSETPDGFSDANKILDESQLEVAL